MLAATLQSLLFYTDTQQGSSLYLKNWLYIDEYLLNSLTPWLVSWPTCKHKDTSTCVACRCNDAARQDQGPHLGRSCALGQLTKPRSCALCTYLAGQPIQARGLECSILCLADQRGSHKVGKHVLDEVGSHLQAAAEQGQGVLRHGVGSEAALWVGTARQATSLQPASCIPSPGPCWHTCCMAMRHARMAVQSTPTATSTSSSLPLPSAALMTSALVLLVAMATSSPRVFCAARHQETAALKCSTLGSQLRCIH